MTILVCHILPRDDIATRGAADTYVVSYNEQRWIQFLLCSYYAVTLITLYFAVFCYNISLFMGQSPRDRALMELHWLPLASMLPTAVHTDAHQSLPPPDAHGSHWPVSSHHQRLPDAGQTRLVSQSVDPCASITTQDMDWTCVGFARGLSGWVELGQRVTGGWVELGLRVILPSLNCK